MKAGCFQDKVALVTGGSRGIGLSMVETLIMEGAIVYLADIDLDGGQSVEKRLRDKGFRVTFIPCDVASEPSVHQLALGIREGHLHVLLNNAGVELSKGIEDTTLVEWDLLSDVNLRGTFLVTQAMLPLLKKANGASVVNTASISGLIGWPESTAYCATKGGIINLTRQMACDLAQFNIRVNAICPGTTNTPMIRRLIWEGPEPEETARKIADMHLLRRFAEPIEIANAALFLASDDASFVTGAIIPVDGGYTAK